MKGTIFNIVLVSATITLLAKPAHAVEICGNNQDDDRDGLQDEGCASGLATGVCESPLSCNETGWVSPLLGALHYQLPPDISPKVPFGPGIGLRRFYTSQYSPGATISMNAAGVSVSGTFSVSPSWPPHQPNDVALLLVETAGTQAATLSNAQGFMPVTGSPQGDNVDINGTVLTVFWKRATSSSEPAPVVADSGDHTLAVIITFRNVVTTGNPWDVTAGDATAGSASSAYSIPGATTAADNELVVAIVATSTYTAQYANDADNPDLVAINRQVKPGTLSGNQGRLNVTTGTKLSMGSYGPTTGTLASSARQARMSIALRPVNDAPVWQRPMGERWQHTYMTWLTKTGSAPTSSIVLHTPNGQDILSAYTTAAAGWETYTPQTGFHAQYIRQRQASPNEFEVKLLTGETLVYNSSGRLTEIWDTLSTPNKVTVAYDANSQVSTVTDSSAKRRLLFSYIGSTLTTVNFQVKIAGVFTTYHATTYGYVNNRLASITIGGQLAQTNVYTNNYLTQIQDGSGKSIIAFDYNDTHGRVAGVDARSGVLGYEYNSTRAACLGKTILYFNLGSTNSCNVDADCGSGFLCGGKTGSGFTGRGFRGARCLTVSSPSEDVITGVTAVGPPSESCDGSCLEASSYVWNTGAGVLDLGAIQDPSGNYTVGSFNSNGLPTTINFGDIDTTVANTNSARQMFVDYDTSIPGRVAKIRRKTNFEPSGATACTASSGTCAQTEYIYTGGVLTSMIQTGYTMDYTKNGAKSFSYVTNYTYDAKGRLTRIDGPLVGANDVTDFTYYSDASGTFDDGFLDELRQKKDSSNFITRRAFLYDFWGNPTKLLAPDNAYSCLQFDSARGFLKRRVQSMGDQGDCSANSADIVTEWERDSNLRLTKVVRPDGDCVFYEYDSKGRLLRTKRRDDCILSSSGDRQEFVYDAEGLLVELQSYDSSNILTAKQPYTYYDSRRLARIVNPVDASKWTGFTYDSRGLVSQVDAPNGLGKIVFNRTNTPGQEGRLTSVDRYKTTSTFDTWNLLFAWIGEQLQVTDGDAFSTTTVHDDLGRVVRLTSVDMDAPRLQAYDASSRLTTVVDGYGLATQQIHAFTFDNLGRPLTDDLAVGTSEGICPDATSNPPEIERIYDAPPTCPLEAQDETCDHTGGRLAYVRVRLMCNATLGADKALDQETFYSYDSAGRVIKEFIRDDAGREAYHAYLWTKGGALRAMDTPNSAGLEWAYGSVGNNSDTDRITAVSRNGQLVQIATSVEWFPYGPLKQYNQQSTLSGNATRTRFTRNLAYRPTGIYTETQSGATTLQSIALTEDAKGRVIGRNYTPNTLGVDDSYFLYDDQDRVLCETATSVGVCPTTGGGIKNSHTASPPFRNSGGWKENRYSVGATAYIRKYNDGITPVSHRVANVTEASAALGITEYGYYPDGSRYYEDNSTQSFDIRAFGYDPRKNRVLTVGYYRQGGVWYSYSSTSAFDAFNRRVYQGVQKNDTLSTYFYYYDAYDRLTEVDYTPNTASPSTHQVFQLHWIDDKLVAYWQTDFPSGAESKRYVVTDETDRPIEMWNWPSSGDTARVWAVNPSAYGVDANVLGATYYQPVLFAGQLVDAETTSYRDDGTTVLRPALVHNGYRTFDPFIGGYLQVDPLANQTWNSYLYADGNPVGNSDRFGLAEDCSDCVGHEYINIVDSKPEGDPGPLEEPGWTPWGNLLPGPCVTMQCLVPEAPGGGGGGTPPPPDDCDAACWHERIHKVFNYKQLHEQPLIEKPYCYPETEETIREDVRRECLLDDVICDVRYGRTGVPVPDPNPRCEACNIAISSLYDICGKTFRSAPTHSTYSVSSDLWR